jgi:hypothetical protein
MSIYFSASASGGYISGSGSASGFGSTSSDGATCNSSYMVGGELPHQINNTYICGVNPYTDRAILEKCCQGPITNITSPAPTAGPYSASWPVTCLAYCPILLKPFYDGVKDNEALNNFRTCMGDAIIANVCTEVNGPAPNECLPMSPSIGCTDRFSHSTWDGSTYVSTFASATAHGAAQKTSGPAQTGDASITSPPSQDQTAVPTTTSTKSAARNYKPLPLTAIITATLVLQSLCFSPLI